MIKQLYIIDYENAHWCGGQLHVCVWAESEDDAVTIAESHMEDAQRELFSSEFEEMLNDDDYGDDIDGPAYTVNSVEVLDENNEFWKYYQDPVQRANFYPTIGEENE